MEIEYTLTNILQFCYDNFDKHAKIVGKWIKLRCPFAQWKHVNGTDSNPSFGISVEYPNGYNCFSCGSKGINFINLLKGLNYNVTFGQDVNNYNFHLSYYTDNSWINVPPFVSYDNILKQLKPCYDHPYLAERDIDFEIAQQFDIRYDEISKRICFPIYNVNNCCVGIQGRTVVNVLPKYKFYTVNGESNNNLLYGENYVNFDDPLVIVEGVIDVAKVKQLWYNVTTFFGVNPSQGVLKKLHFSRKILMLFDNDKPGDLACETLKNMLHYTNCIDIRQSLGFKDPGETPIGVLKQLLTNYVKV